MNKRTISCMAAASIFPATILLMAFSKGPLPQHTGGFREDTCRNCHLEFPLNEGRLRGGTFYISGVPKEYAPGATYPLTVVIGQPGQSRWGFQLTSRFVGSEGQAGDLTPVDGLTQVLESQGIQYIEHTEEGTRKGLQDGPVEFHFNWTAPSQPQGPIYFNAAGNAADSSDWPLGDYIYTAGAYSNQAGGPSPDVLTQSERPGKFAGRLNQSSRFMHLPAPVDLKKGEKELHIEHRFLGNFFDSRPGNAFGSDFGANINLGMNYALNDRLSAGVSRSRFEFSDFQFGVVTFNGTYELFNNSESFWQMSLHGGVEGQENFERHYSPYLQLPTSFQFGRLKTHVVPTMIFNSRNDEDVAGSRRRVINAGDNHTFSLGLGLDFAVHRRVSFTGEYVPRLAGFGGFGNDRATLAWGTKISTFGHVFTIMLSNTRDFTPAKYGVNAESTDFVLGFNIYRKF